MLLPVEVPEGEVPFLQRGWNAYEHRMAWLLKAPRDLLALRGSHDAHLALGDGLGALESVARVRPLWNQSVFGYSQVLSMHAMALTEASAGS